MTFQPNLKVIRIHIAVVFVGVIVKGDRTGTVFFHPEKPMLGNVPPGTLGEEHFRLKVHNVAFMLRVLRSVVRDLRPGAPEDGAEPLTSRFPSVRVPEHHKVKRHCRHDFVSCVTYLSKEAHNLGISTKNDPLTLKKGRLEGMCNHQSNKSNIFCDSREKENLIQEQKQVKKEATTDKKQMRRKSIGERIRNSIKKIHAPKVIKPKHKPKQGSLFEFLKKFVINVVKEIKEEIEKGTEKESTVNKLRSMAANRLDLYIETVTALQYMCWYTMHGIPYLAHLLQCDSTDPQNSKPDKDVRANNYNDPFGCAIYSFCPNPCCGGLKEPNLENCWNRFSNPCRLHGIAAGKGCKISRALNLNYHQLVDHGIQVSCDCGTGRRYDSRAGMCVWRDHCSDPYKACPKPHQRCFNVYGGYECRCEPDYRWRSYDRECVPIYPKKEKKWGWGLDNKEKDEEGKGSEEGIKKKLPLFKLLFSLFIKDDPPQTAQQNHNWYTI